MGHTLRCCVWCWVFHGGIGLATTSYMGTYQNYLTRSRAGGLSWRDTALAIRHFELLACDLVTWEPAAQRGETKRGRPRLPCLTLSDPHSKEGRVRAAYKTKAELPVSANFCLGTSGFVASEGNVERSRAARQANLN